MVGTDQYWTATRMDRWLGCAEGQISLEHSDQLVGLITPASLATSHDDRRRRQYPESDLSHHCIHMRDPGAWIEQADIMQTGRVRAEQVVLWRTASNRTSAGLVGTDLGCLQRVGRDAHGTAKLT